jgi:transposase
LRVRVEMMEAERAEWRAQAESTVERLTRRIERERDEAEHAQKRAHEQELRRMERALETARTEAEEQARAAKFRSQMELEYLTREVTELRELKRTLTAAVDSERAERYAERLRAQEEIAKARGEVTRAKAQSESAQQLDVVRGMAGILKEADPEMRPMLTQSFGAQLGVPVHEPTVVERLINEVGKNPELIEPVVAWVRDRVFGAPQPGVNVAALPSKRL